MRISTIVAVAILVMATDAATANCTPADNAKLGSIGRRQKVLEAKMNAGDCSVYPEYIQISNVSIAILSDSAQRPNCWVKWKRRSATWPACVGATKTAKMAPPAKTQSPPSATQPAVPRQLGIAARSSSCSDITGTNSKASAARNCNQAKSALNTARAAQKKNPGRATEQYKKAADAYRRAGDTEQADATLLEAAGQVAVATSPEPSHPMTGASAPPAAGPPPAAATSTSPRMWSGRTEDCKLAGRLESKTAAYYTMCMPAEKFRPNAYKPPISPQDLTARAIEYCKEVRWAEKRQCIFDFKLRTLLAEDPNVRAECSSVSGTDRIECVDAIFLYGPGANGRIAERENLRRKIASMPDYLLDRTSGPARPPVQSAPDSPCPPGQGVKPTPGSFGGWSCQLLGLIWLAPNRPKPDAASPQSSNAPTGLDPVQAFEERVNHVAAAAVVAVADATGMQLSAVDREMCMVAAFAAVHSTLKGGVPPVPEKCRAMAGAAHMELAYYAGAHIDTMSNPGVEELLSSFSVRNSSSGLENAGTLGPAQRETAAPDCAQAESHWRAAEDLKLLAIYEDHLARFATCNFAAVAAARIEQLRKR